MSLFFRSPAAFAIACVAILSAPARANGRFPATNQFLTRPGDVSHLALRTTFGLLRSDNAGVTWDWVCERVVGYAGTEDPALVWHRDGELVAGLFDGLAVADANTCSWARDAAIDKQVVVDVSMANAEGSSLDALTGSYDPVTTIVDPGYISAIWSTVGDARRWTQTSTLLPRDVIVESFDRAASDPQRLYVTGESESGGVRSGVFVRSRDGGQTWERKAFDLDPTGEHSVFLAAIDPRRADRLYVRTSGSDAGRVLVSDDAGETFRAIWSGSPPQGFALDDDGSNVWVGAFQEGLARASTTDFAFTTMNTIPIGCLHHAGSALFACSLDAYGFAAGRSDDGGHTFEPLLHFASIRGPRECAAGAGQAVCAADWPVVKSGLGIQDEVPDAGAVPVFDGGANSSSASTSACGCRMTGRPAPKRNATVAWLLAGATVAFVRRKRRTTSSSLPRRR